MSVSKMLIDALREHMARSRDMIETTVSARDGDVQASLRFADGDRYSVALRSLSVGAGNVSDDVRGYLSATAAELARRLSFLEEPLAVWELDSNACAVQLRSSPPQREGEEIIYWEVVLDSTEQPRASLARYRWTPNMIEREAMDYPATFALVSRITDSLVAALQQPG